MALGFDVNIIGPLGIGAQGFADTGGDSQEMTVVPVRTVAQGIGPMLGSKLCEGCNEPSRRHAIHRKAKSRGRCWTQAMLMATPAMILMLLVVIVIPASASGFVLERKIQEE